MIMIKKEPGLDENLYQSPQLADQKLTTDNIVNATPYRNLQTELKNEEPITAPFQQEKPA